MKLSISICAGLIAAAIGSQGLALAEVATNSPSTDHLLSTSETEKHWVSIGNSGMKSWLTNLANAPDNTLYLSYTEDSDGKAVVRKFDGKNWVVVGNPYFTPGRINGAPFITVAPDGTPYVGFQNMEDSYKANVMKLDGNKWTNVGQPNFSMGAAFNLKMAFAPNGDLYAAFLDQGTKRSNIATVMKLVNGKWVNTGLSLPLYTLSIDLAISPAGIPYISYSAQGYPNPNSAGVMTLVANKWLLVGKLDFLTGTHGNGPILAIAPNGTPYIVYPDMANTLKLAVSKFDGSQWTRVGQTSVSLGGIDMMHMQFAADSTPYISYRDHGNGAKVSVSALNGEQWTPIGQPLTSGNVVSASLSISNQEPCVAYTENTEGVSGFKPYPLTVKCYGVPPAN